VVPDFKERRKTRKTPTNTGFSERQKTHYDRNNQKIHKKKGGKRRKKPRWLRNKMKDVKNINPEGVKGDYVLIELWWN
jgi:hypothetical protein